MQLQDIAECELLIVIVPDNRMWNCFSAQHDCLSRFPLPHHWSLIFDSFCSCFLLFFHLLSLCEACHVVKHQLFICGCIRSAWFVARDLPVNANTAEWLSWKWDWNPDFNRIHFEKRGETASNLITKDELCTAAAVLESFVSPSVCSKQGQWTQVII